ncbi:hypothetical protein B5K11_09575 [Rhizobium leguminosarum bv. trifolii]|uniref:hypothetical protein n=1 Tax=Rhizobium leguminosarum TaxID=384 RepID=UPI000E2F886F|nr:hypothetical protein [Rhizobium leguminosarum]RFB95195.1 hypothetical protein B5K11_09575 [Rhizobium leguminosarum bv. trifolii]
MVEVATITGWGLAATFMVVWLVGQRLRAYAIFEREAALRTQMRIAVDFVTDVVEPATHDLFAAVEFLPVWLSGDWQTIDEAWPQWRPYLAARLAGRKWEAHA